MNKKYDFYYLTFTWIDKIQFQSQQRGLSLSDGNFGTSFLQLTKNSRNHFVMLSLTLPLALMISLMKNKK